MMDKSSTIALAMNVRERIEQKLTAGLKPSHLEVINESNRHNVPAGSETHFRLIVVSEKFAGLSLIQRQRRIYDLLKEELSGPVHALSQKTFSPQEWSARSQDPLPSPPCQGGGRPRS